MPNISDYINWRGDLSFTVDSFNIVDNLILSQLAYVDFKNIIPSVESKDKITLEQACENFFELHSEKELKKIKSFVSEMPLFMKKVSETERFKNILLSDFSENINEEEQKQFGAFKVELPDKSIFVVFLGTDDNIISWKEDLNMASMAPVPAQKEAVRYVNKVLNNEKGQIRMGGHSKGGNLAIYAAAFCDNKIKDGIVKVYNNDGPGFEKNITKLQEYKQILPKVISIVPQDSFIGMLLEHEEKRIIVKSTQKGILQHDAMSWQVIGNRFVTCKDISSGSRKINTAVSRWIEDLSKDERKDFTDAIFEIITAGGADKLSDVNSDFLKNTSASVKMFFSLDTETRTLILKILHLLSYEINKVTHNK